MRRGLLLVNLGTPDKADVPAVRNYLRQFLMDKRVIDIPALLRTVLVYLLILPLRAKRSAKAYQSIWTEQGSPLLYHSQNIIRQVQKEIGADWEVALGMRYGKPSIKVALDGLKHCESITIMPLYPQYSSAASGSSIEEVMRLVSTWELIPSLTIIRDFFQNPAYIKAQAQIIKAHLDEKSHLLFSYHGIPERQIIKSSCNFVCSEVCPTLSPEIQGCYKAQCHQNSRLLAKALELPERRYSTSFQSRLGKTPWIKPYTDEVLADLAAKGIKKLTIVCPSFVADCLETIEEIGMAAKESWQKLGGEQFTLVPCMNDDPLWIKAIVTIVHLQTGSVR